MSKESIHFFGGHSVYIFRQIVEQNGNTMVQYINYLLTLRNSPRLIWARRASYNTTELAPALIAVNLA